tara:strand:+ start:200 stop:478 length:279 start_codon:yes stop_codon:yes gene_type:complete
MSAIDDVDVLIEDSTPLEAIVEGVEEIHSQSPEDDERNREYLIRRAALGDDPTQEEMDEVGSMPVRRRASEISSGVLKGWRGRLRRHQLGKR